MSGRLSDLNPEQRAAAAHLEGPLLILAGAGSGKTRVITHRIAHLVDGGVDPQKILAVTFTNKAAGEMRGRVEALLGARAAGVWIGTFHSAGVRILRRDGTRIGLPRNLVIYDDADQLALVRRILKSLGLDPQAYPPRMILSRIDRAKSRRKGPDDLEVGPFDPVGLRVREVYGRYQAALRAAGAVDFGDLLAESVRLLVEAPDVLEGYHRRLEHVMVDEFQDTNSVQYELVRLLAGPKKNLVVVGDDDQAIYKWRGADIENILSFERDHPDAKVVRLEQNYRSTQLILDAAFAVISKNVGRKEKRLWTDAEGGEPIEIFQAGDEQDEARVVAAIASRLADDGPRREIAVFYRVNAQSRAIEDALRAARIPYHVVRGRSFYDRAEIKDLTAYLRLAVNPDSDADFLRVVNTPRRGIGTRTVERLVRAAEQAGTSLASRVRTGEPIPDVSAATVRKLRAFTTLVDDLHALVETDRPPQEIVEDAIERSGYADALRAERTEEAEGRLENLVEMVSAATARADEGKSLIDLLDEMALTADADDMTDDPDRLNLMTLHAAKGLEFDSVIITGMEERTFPHARAFSPGGFDTDPDEIAEERRLCYVGFTRARKRLYLTCARTRWLMGDRQVRGPSRFLGDLPPELVRGTEPALDDTEPELGDEDGIVIDYSYDQRPEVRGPIRGRRVHHRTFGEGEIRAVDGAGPAARLLVHFEGVGTKKILARYVELL